MAIKRKNTYTDISLDFNIHPISKDIVKVIDDNAIKQSVETLLDMDYFETPMQPKKGSRIKRLLFEPLGLDIVIELKEAIKSAVLEYIANNPGVDYVDIGHHFIQHNHTAMVAATELIDENKVSRTWNGRYYIFT